MEKGACVPLRVHTIVVSVQHSEQISIDQLRSDLMEHVVKGVVPHQYLDEKTVYHLQPSGKFVIGGPQVNRHYCPTALPLQEFSLQCSDNVGWVSGRASML